MNGLTVQISPFRGLRWMFIPEATMKHNTINADLNVMALQTIIIGIFIMYGMVVLQCYAGNKIKYTVSEYFLYTSINNYYLHLSHRYVVIALYVPRCISLFYSNGFTCLS